MAYDRIVEQRLDRCKGFLESILQAPARHSVAAASLAIVERIREVARALLQAKVELAANQCRYQDVPPAARRPR